MKRFFHTTIKMGLGSFLAIVIAEGIGLEYAITAGILAVLSTQLTRKDSLVIAFRRFLGALLGIGISTVMFVVFGYTVWVFSVFTVVFIGVSFFFKLSEGIVPSLVLVSHLLVYGSFSIVTIGNGFGLLGIAIVVVLILNSIYPLNTQSVLMDSTNQIDRLIVEELSHLADVLNGVHPVEGGKQVHDDNSTQLYALLNEAELVDKDMLFDNDHRHLAYLRMRYAQINRLKRLYDLVEQVDTSQLHAHMLGEFVEHLSYDIGYADKARKQLGLLDRLLNAFREMDLPKTRDEFETRAILFQMVFEIKAFLNLKIVFHSDYPNYEGEIRALNNKESRRLNA